MAIPAPQLLPLTQQIARHLRSRRHTLGYSQRDLAVRVGTSQAMIARIEAGTGNPSLKTLERIMDALDVQVSIRITNRPH